MMTYGHNGLPVIQTHIDCLSGLMLTHKIVCHYVTGVSNLLNSVTKPSVHPTIFMILNNQSLDWKSAETLIPEFC